MPPKKDAPPIYSDYRIQYDAYCNVSPAQAKEKAAALKTAITLHDALLEQVVTRSLDTSAAMLNTKIQEDVCVLTGLRSSDGVRFLYVSVKGCVVKDVRAFMLAIQENEFTKESLAQMIPAGATLADLHPSSSLVLLNISEETR